MPNRYGQDDDYRYGFNGHESDGEVYGSKGSSYDFGARMYDSRIARFNSSDPWEDKYPWQSSYAYFKNSPISTIDWKGFGESDWTPNGDGTWTAEAGDGAESLAKDAGISREKAYSLLENQGMGTYEDEDDCIIKSAVDPGDIVSLNEKSSIYIPRTFKETIDFEPTTFSNETSFEDISLLTAGTAVRKSADLLNGSSMRFSTTKLGFSPKLYTNGWGGNQYTNTFKTTNLSTGLKIGGMGLSIYSLYSTTDAYNAGEISISTRDYNYLNIGASMVFPPAAIPTFAGSYLGAKYEKDITYQITEGAIGTYGQKAFEWIFGPTPGTENK